MNRKWTARGALVLAALVPVVTRAAEPTTQPTTQPTTPAVARATPLVDVYLVPFRPVGGPVLDPSVGTAAEQNLLSDLARAGHRPAAADRVLDDPVGAARDVGARYLITGTYQASDDLLRFNAQVVDVASGTVVGGLSTTGPRRDLFTLEDAISTQALHQLARVAVDRSLPRQPAPPAAPPAAVTVIIQPPAVGVASHYEGSALQAYVDGNRTPSVEYAQQVQNVRDASTFGSYNTYGGLDDAGFGFGGFGFPGFGYGGFGYGGIGYGGYYGGLGSTGFGYGGAYGGGYGNAGGGGHGGGHGGGYHGGGSHR